jgi:hypothetical protein
MPVRRLVERLKARERSVRGNLDGDAIFRLEIATTAFGLLAITSLSH